MRAEIAKKENISVSDKIYEDYKTSYHQNWPKLPDIVEGGLDQFHAQITAGFDKWAARLAKEEDASIAGEAHLQRVEVPWDFCAFVAVASLYLATWGVMGVLGFTIFTGGIGAVLLAIAGLALAIAGMFCL